MKMAAGIVHGLVAGLVLTQAALNPVSAAAAPADFLACAPEKDDTRRLACFDAVVTLAMAQPAASLAAPPPPETAPTPLSKEERFGLRGDLKEEKAKQAPELAEIQELKAQVTRVAAKPHGELVLTLDNGQVWYEIQTSSGIRVKTGDTVTIKAGALGSFSLIAPNGRSSKVTRSR
jgi:hypothetical protein